MASGNGFAAADKLASSTKSKVAAKAVKDGKIDWDHVDTAIERKGSKIVLPSDPAHMPIPAAIAALQRRMEDEEQEMSVHEVIEAFPLDGAVAFMEALRLTYGWASPVPTPGFFGPKPPHMITVQTGPNPEDQIQVPWGAFVVPGIEKPVNTTMDEKDGAPVFVIYGTLRKKESHILKDIANLTRQIVAERSIYRGKAIRLRTDSDGDLDIDLAPTFIQTSHVKPDELILSELVEQLVETNIYTLIKHTQACIDNKIPLKRGVLLEGKYGTGKTLTATVCAKHCVDHGWTFIMLDRCQGLAQALHFAKRYQPAVIFAEDIDRATTERNEKANDLLNILDGILSKDAKLMVVLTTNHLEKINKAMLRPGRLDAVISVTPPDSKAVQRLIRLYARERLAKDVTLDRVGAELDGSIPAVIREVVERSKLAMISREATSINEDDLLVSARGMKAHSDLIAEPANETKSNPIDRLADDLAQIIGGIVARDLAKYAVQQTHNHSVTRSEMRDHLQRIGREVAGGTQSIDNRLGLIHADTDRIRNAVARS